MKLPLKTVFVLSLVLTISVTADAGIVSGKVSSTVGTPLRNVPVSDGVSIALTDSSGNYSMETEKELGYVFVITPSGYEPATSHANRPDFWKLITTPTGEDDIVDFTLRPVDDSSYAFIAISDSQVGNRRGEVNCLKSKTIPDINMALDSLRDEGLEPFIIMLGDQAYDRYWKPNRYGLQEAYSDLEALDAMMYSVMGNHDNDPTGTTDLEASWEWRRTVGPTYYSFNKRGVHFVVLDDIEVVDGSPDLSKNGECVYKHHLSQDQLDWLKKDLAFVDKTTPILLALHCPLYTAPGTEATYRVTNGQDLVDILEGYNNVEIISGHTHISSGAEDKERGIYETNYGAVCGSWWLNARVDLGNDNNICRDGTPSGYAIWTYKEGKLSNVFKGTGLPVSRQFRTYDMNNVEFDNEEIAGEFQKGREKTNDVLINVWSYGPGWTVEASENGIPLEVERVRSKNPLFILSYPIPYVNLGYKLTGTVRPVFTWHIFKVKASAPDTTIDVKVTDREGRVYTERMERPKAFTTEL